MKHDAIFRVIKKVKLAYPTQKLYENQQELEGLIELWHELLGMYTEDAVMRALNNHILESKYQPTIADIETQIESLRKAWLEELSFARETLEEDEDAVRVHEQGEYGWLSPEELDEKRKYINITKKRIKELEEFKIFEDEH